VLIAGPNLMIDRIGWARFRDTAPG
jgi:hypothetical protein